MSGKGKKSKSTVASGTRSKKKAKATTPKGKIVQSKQASSESQFVTPTKKGPGTGNKGHLVIIPTDKSKAAFMTTTSSGSPVPGTWEKMETLAGQYGSKVFVNWAEALIHVAQLNEAKESSGSDDAHHDGVYEDSKPAAVEGEQAQNVQQDDVAENVQHVAAVDADARAQGGAPVVDPAIVAALGNGNVAAVNPDVIEAILAAARRGGNFAQGRAQVPPVGGRIVDVGVARSEVAVAQNGNMADAAAGPVMAANQNLVVGMANGGMMPVGAVENNAGGAAQAVVGGIQRHVAGGSAQERLQAMKERLGEKSNRGKILKIYVFPSLNGIVPVAFDLVERNNNAQMWQFKASNVPEVLAALGDEFSLASNAYLRSVETGKARQHPYGANVTRKNNKEFDCDVLVGFIVQNQFQNSAAQVESIAPAVKVMCADPMFQQFYVEGLGVYAQGLAKYFKDGRATLWNAMAEATTQVAHKEGLNVLFTDVTIAHIMRKLTNGKSPHQWNDAETRFAYNDGVVPASIHNL